MVPIEFRLLLVLLLSGAMAADRDSSGVRPLPARSGPPPPLVSNANSTKSATSSVSSSSSSSFNSTESVSSLDEVIMAAESQASESKTFRRRSDAWYQQQHAQDSNDGLHPPMPYSFSYDIHDYLGNKQYRKEEADGSGAVTGSYGFWGPDGIYRHVDYIADQNGFRANVKTSEPGTASENPADVTLSADPVYLPPSGQGGISQHTAQMSLPFPSSPAPPPPPPPPRQPSTENFGYGGDWRRRGGQAVKSGSGGSGGGGSGGASKGPPSSWTTKHDSFSSGRGSSRPVPSSRGSSSGSGIISGTYSSSTGFGGNSYGSSPSFSRKGGDGGQRRGRTQGQTTKSRLAPPQPTAYIPPVVVNVAPLSGSKSVSISTSKTTAARRPGQRTYVPLVPPPIEEYIQLKESGKVPAKDFYFRAAYPARDGRRSSVFSTAGHMSTAPSTTIQSPPPAGTTTEAYPPTAIFTTTTSPELISTTTLPHDGNVLDRGPVVETFTVTPQRANKVQAVPSRYGARLNPSEEDPSDPSMSSSANMITTPPGPDHSNSAARPGQYVANNLAEEAPHQQMRSVQDQPHHPHHYRDSDELGRGRSRSYDYRGLDALAGHEQNPPTVLDWRTARSALTNRDNSQSQSQNVPDQDHRPENRERDGRTRAHYHYDDREWHPQRSTGRSRRHHNHFETLGSEGTNVNLNHQHQYESDGHNGRWTPVDNLGRYGYTVYSNGVPQNERPGSGGGEAVLVEDVVGLSRPRPPPPVHPVPLRYQMPTETYTDLPPTSLPPTPTRGPFTTTDKNKDFSGLTTSSAFREVSTDSGLDSAASSPKPWVRQFYAGESVYGYGVPTLRDHMNEFLHLDYEGDDYADEDYTGTGSGTTGRTAAAVTTTIPITTTAAPYMETIKTTIMTTTTTTPRPRVVFSSGPSSPEDVRGRGPPPQYGARLRPAANSNHTNTDRPRVTEWIQRHGSGGPVTLQWKK